LHAQDQGPGTSNPYLKAIERTDPGHAPNADEGGGFIDTPGLYAKGGLGLTFVSEATNSGTGNNNDAEYEFGYLISGGLGIDLQNNLRFEAEMNYHKSDLQSMVGTASSTAVSTGNMGGDLTALTIMGNLAYDFRNQTRFTPFVMGGLGLARLALNDTSANGVVVANASDWVYAMQIGGGVSLDLTEKWSLEAAYRYMETGDPSYGDANATPFESEYASHNFLMGAKYKF
jgi:opacity protein-like surface antigen